MPDSDIPIQGKATLTDPRPVPPAEPDPADCCGEGCVRCIHDVHDDALERYREALEKWQARQPEGNGMDHH